ncbi:hypothetical protein HK105_200969 [Polyrhizophydium stewartii]|uniref:Uncharacterized protein n=1 Tax=Polyrhizophydium stewartii TaxID=2732419 RepID=A0ABR4NIH1_9FUNG
MELQARCEAMQQQRDEALAAHDRWVREFKEEHDMALFKKFKDVLNAKKQKIREQQKINDELG